MTELGREVCSKGSPAVNAAHEWYAGRFETPLNDRGNLLTRRWGALRGVSDRIRKDAGIKQHFRMLQKEWLGDLAGKRVLDFGCGQGNNISLHMAQEADDYLACDLSEPAIAVLRGKLDAHGLDDAKTIAGDFLSVELPAEPFDVVYANSVLHAFHPLEEVLIPLFDRMAPGGMLITMEPMQTSLPVWIARRIARSFRTDAAFNWPFSRSDFVTLQRYFEIQAVQGFYGWSKWTVPLAVIPGLQGPATRLARRLHVWDVRQASQLGRGLWRCNSVTMLLRRRETIVD